MGRRLSHCMTSKVFRLAVEHGQLDVHEHEIAALATPSAPYTGSIPCSRIAAGRKRAPIKAQLMLETTVSYTGLSTLDGKPPRTAPDDWSLKIAPISGLSSRLFGTESHIRSKCPRRSGSG